MCTCFNPLSVGTCEVCGTGKKPPMDQIIAEHKARLAAEAGEPVEVEEAAETPLHKVRLGLLARDLRHIISHE